MIADSDDTVLVEGNHCFSESALNRACFTLIGRARSRQGQEAAQHKRIGCNGWTRVTLRPCFVGCGIRIEAAVLMMAAFSGFGGMRSWQPV